MLNNQSGKDAAASFLPAYAYSPWKTGREKEEQDRLRNIEEIELLDGITGVGNYTFYGCGKLKKLSFTDSVKSIGGGSFTGCSALREIHLLMDADAKSCLKDVISETFHEVYVTVYLRDQKQYLKLIFPEYYEEGVENTPARILETHFHGSGYRYRQCFTDKRLDLKRYDDLFEVAVIYEKKEIVIPMAVGRILYPFALADKSRERYLDYLKDHILEVAEFYLNGREKPETIDENWYEVFTCILEYGDWKEEQLDHCIKTAAALRQTEAVSFFMDKKQKKFAPAKKMFDL